jgi:DNA polymerase III subunit epsilon
MAQIDHAFTVVDCETTGFHPNAHHRIVELAIASVDERGELDEIWCSLLRPERDLGPTEVHGIRGRDVRDAPSFDEILGEVLDRLAGRVVVAHNARFDCAFLEHELSRAGVDVVPLPSLCTMELAGHLGLGGSRMRLVDCCAAIGATPSDTHTAEADALACATLLAAYLSGANSKDIDSLIRGQIRLAESWPRSDERAPCKRRDRSPDVASEPSFLARLVQTADAPLGMDTAQVAPYLDVLDRAIEDRRLSTAEQEELRATATMLGLSAERVRRLHSDYVGTLIAVARRDGIVTDREREDLVLVGEALGIGEIDELLAFRSTSAAGESVDDGLKGKSVCFTGELTCRYDGQPVTREMAHELAEQAGMTIAPRVTKKLDMLVVADPDSLSGKARKAREYEVRIVAEVAFWSMIGVEVS